MSGEHSDSQVIWTFAKHLAGLPTAQRNRELLQSRGAAGKPHRHDLVGATHSVKCRLNGQRAPYSGKQPPLVG